MVDNALDLFEVQPTERMVPGKWVAPLLGEPVLGIDASLRGFALCYSLPGRALIEGEWSSKPCEGVRARMERYEQLIRGTLQVALAHPPELIAIEGYAYSPAGGKTSGHAHDRAELGGVLRWKLCEIVRCPIIEVAPNTLKKFTTGNGQASKDLMVSALAKAHGRTFRTDNAADAFALCQLGLALTGQIPEPSTKAERTYLAGLRKGYGLKEVTS